MDLEVSRAKAPPSPPKPPAPPDTDGPFGPGGFRHLPAAEELGCSFGLLRWPGAVTLGAGGLLFLVIAIAGRLPVMLPLSILCLGVAISLAWGPHRRPPKFAIGMTLVGGGTVALLLLASLVWGVYRAAFGA